jgi:N-acetylmuramoyl-L-alanine amidase
MKFAGKLLVLALSVCSFGVSAADTAVQGVRLWAAPDSTRVVFDSNTPVHYTLSTLSAPERIVIEISDARLQATLPVLHKHKGLVKSVSGATLNGKDLRLVLELTGAVQPKSFTLKPNAQYGDRLVVDLYPQSAAKSEDAAPAPARVATATSHESKVVKKTMPTTARDLVIAIDAGHGGDDPGAHGSAGTNEKDVVLAIARRLCALVQKERGMRPVMIRNGDYYVGLRQRIMKARQAKADLFVSIHADAFKDRHASGSSVFTLSQRGATSEAARWLADSENAADLVGGVSLDDKDDLLASVLLDLSQTATNEASMEVGDKVLGNLTRVGNVHTARVQQAGFVVLKSPDIPSILVETAFISNPNEERKLRDPHHQEVLAQAIMDGIRNYFVHRAPPGTVLAHQANSQHVIGPGETLSSIARQYRVSMQRLRQANGLHDNENVKIGRVLLIPADSDS